MGYRTYIGKISKEEHAKIKDLSYADLMKYYGKDEDDYVGAYKITEQVYEFGKYTEFDDEKFFTPFFTNKETMDCYEGDFHIVTKEYLEHIIKHYREKIQTYYKEMVEPFWGSKVAETSEFIKSMKTDYDDNLKQTYTLDFTKITPEQQTVLWEMLCHVRSMRTEWEILNPYNLEKGDEVTTSWKYEYNIFELVRIYKTFDWENDLLIYYGY